MKQQTPMLAEQVESFLVVLFAVSIFMWKPGIYVSSALIIVYTCIGIFRSQDYRQKYLGSHVAVMSVAMFVVGTTTSLIAMQQTEDLLWMVRKTLFLLTVGFLLIAFNNEKNKKIAFYGLVAGFWVASLLTIFKNWQLMGVITRVEGTWPQGTWDALLGLFLVFLLLSIKDVFSKSVPSLRTKLFLFATLCMSVFQLIWAGGRIPFVACVGAILLYVLTLKLSKRMVINAMLASVIAVMLSVTVFKDHADSLINRVQSITDVSNDDYWVRLNLWKVGFNHAVFFMKNEPSTFLFGAGGKSYGPMQIEFFQDMPMNAVDREKFQSFGYPSGDPHNMYIDSILKNGVIWTILFLIYLLWLATGFKLKQSWQRPEPFILLSFYLVLGIAYTILPHFFTYFLVFFMMYFVSSKNPRRQSGVS
jgi:O-antigen ligase